MWLEIESLCTGIYESTEGTCRFSKKIAEINCAIHSLRLRIRSHGLLIRSLNLHNSFFKIAIRSLDLHNAIRENKLCGSS